MNRAFHWVPAFVFVAAASLGTTDAPLQIETAHGSASEVQTKEQLEGLLRTYNASAYYFTRHIVVEEHAIPHSHPVLTLSTRHLQQDDELMSTFLHEELHWYGVANADKINAAESDLEKLYPQIPVGGQDGARDRESGYLHLIVCYLELQADRQVLGPEKTREIFKFWQNDHYQWIYRTVIQDEAKIGERVKAHGLSIPNQH